MFTEYEAEFLSATHTIASNISSIESRSAAERESLTKATQKLVDSAADLLKQMEMEARSQPAADSKKSKATVKTHQASLAGLRTSLKEASSRGDLLGGGGNGSDVESNKERDRLILANDKLQRGTDKLRDAYRTAMETEAIGARVMGDLHDQRETIERSRGRLTKAGAGAADAAHAG